MEEFRKEFNIIKEEILNLRESLDLKEEQIKTLKESIEFKETRIRNLEDAIEEKQSQIYALNEVIEQKKTELIKVRRDFDDETFIYEKEKKIKDLENEVSNLKKALEARPVEKDEAPPKEEIKDRSIVDFTNIEISQEEIFSKMNEILSSATHSINIAIPKITDLNKLSIYDIKSSIVVKISCLINQNVEDHSELFEELKSRGNISIRNYDREDKYIILRDSEELLFSIIGEEENNFLAFYSRDSKHIKAITPIVMDIWLRSKKI
ncbi:MAG: hypothetical protein BAJALOKI1v1_600017 [Promethearchaeota archaeon]|nr:MAG: hypothetical protein BAJALOKI1v1_600017 [Candidatus Lokiarchaeota archaeon]